MRPCALDTLEKVIAAGCNCKAICWHETNPRPAKCPICVGLYGKWCQAKHRCHTKGYKEYDLYGGRGIAMCDEWRFNFNAFRKWAYERGYRHGLEIDRRNRNKGYEPGNCRFVDGFGQAQNYGKMRTCRGKPTASRFKGVFKRGEKWRACIQANKIRYSIGTFDTEEEAAIAYDVFAKRLHGEFAVLNFTEEELTDSAA